MKKPETTGKKGSSGRNRSLAVWLSTAEVARLEGITRVTVNWRCRHGVYHKVKRVRSQGGQQWLVDLCDPKISRLARQRFNLSLFFIPLWTGIVKTETDLINSRLATLEKMMIELRGYIG